MVLIFTDNETLNKDLNKNIENSRIVYYTNYILEEKEADILITTIQPNKYDFKELMFKVRNKDIRVILLLENFKVKELNYSLQLGIYDIIFNPFISLLYVRFSQPRTLKLYNIIPLKATTKTLSLMEFTKKFFHSRMF